MANSEGSNIGQSNTDKFDKTAYQREYMRKKREVEKLKDEQREDREGGVDASESPVEAVPLPTVVMTRTDRKFEEQRPKYWIYGKEVIERECWKCGEGFKTRLEMNKFCGPKCKEEWLTQTFGKLKGVEKV